MGLLTVPKKYNPPGNGRRDMESLIYANRQERGLLKALGGSGRMTRHGIRSYSWRDDSSSSSNGTKDSNSSSSSSSSNSSSSNSPGGNSTAGNQVNRGNVVGSAGGSNYTGDGVGGQVNLDNVGGQTGNVLRNIAGKWTIVDKVTGAARDPEGRSFSNPVPQLQYSPIPAAQTIPTPISLPSIPASTLAAQYGMYKNPTANMPSTPAPAAPVNNSSYFGDVSSYGGTTPSPTVNAVSPLGMGGTRGSWATPSRPPNNTPASPSPNSMPGNIDTGLNYGPGTTPSALQGMGGTRGSWATPSRPPNNTPSTPVSNGPSSRPQMPNYGPGPAVDPGMSNNASYFGDVSDFQGSTPARTAGTSMLAEAQRRAASNRLQEQYSQYRSPPGSPMSPGGLDRYADMTTGGKFGSASTQAGMTPQATPDRAFNVGVMDAPRLSADPTNGISAYPGAGVPDLPTFKDQSRIAQGLKEYDTYDRIAPTIKDQSRIPAAPDYTNRFAPPPSEVSADLYSRVGQLIDAMNRPRESEVGVPANMGPTFGPETPKGPEGWQQGDVNIDPTGNPIVDFLEERAKNTPLYQTTEKIFNAVDRAANGQYYDDVSLGTDESGRRTDRMPSGGGFSTSPGSFGPGGGDRRGGGGRGGSGRNAPKPDTDTPPVVPGTPTAPTVNQVLPWFYPQYQSLWAGLPTGQGGTYGRA